MKKLIVFISSIVCIFGLFLYLYFHSYSYTLEYSVNDIDVKEVFNKEKNYYQFILKYKDVEYSFVSLDNYKTKRNLIEDISVEEKDDAICLIPSSSKVLVYPVCKKGDIYIAYPFNNSEEEGFIYNNFNVNHLFNKTYLLWDYKGFVLLNGKTKEHIAVFDKDVYSLNYAMQMNQYLLLADYDSEYSFKQMYMIDIKKKNVKKIPLRYELSFDGYFLGYNKNMVYLYDKKQEQEYYINVKKGKIYKTNNKILKDNTWETVSDYKLKEEMVRFYNEDIVTYEIKDNVLYSFINGNYTTKVYENVKDIVKVDGLTVYFLSDDSLYIYHPKDGVQKIMSYAEWRFNYKNMIYIFD